MQNYSIIVNHRERGFGCTKACSYCSWRTSKFLPHGLQNLDDIADFARRCERPFVTLSGGGDPLYRFEIYGEALIAAVRAIRDAGKKVRIITREVAALRSTIELFDYVSISLDYETELELRQARNRFRGFDIECSLVAPMLRTADLIDLMPSYAATQRRIGYPLVIRENLNSAAILDIRAICGKLPHNVKFSSKATCLEGRYLLEEQEVTGTAFLFNMERLYDCLATDPNTYIYGGFLRHLYNPRKYHEYGDIDLVIVGNSPIGLLEQQSYEFKEITAAFGRHPRYYIGTSLVGGPKIHIVRFETHAAAETHLSLAQFRMDTLWKKCGNYGAAGPLQPILEDLDKGLAVKVTAVNHCRTEGIERHHANKLLQKGFQIV
jgi:hypothetical protein